MSDVTATFAIHTESDASKILAKDVASAKEYAKEIEKLRTQSNSLVAAEKRLVGSSADVEAARKGVKAQNKAILSDIGRLELANLKLAEAEKKAAREAKPKGIRETIKSKLPTSKGMGAVATKMEGKLADGLKEAERIWTHRGAIFEATIQKTGVVLKAAAKNALGGVGSAMGKMATWAAGGVLALGALATTAGVLALRSADAERSAQAHRVALTGTVEQAEALNTWEKHLADSTGLSREQINQSAKAYSTARLSNKEYTASLEASAIAQTAMGDELASKVSELNTRWGRRGVFTLGRFELDGTGLQTAEVAKSLAKSTNTSVAEAQRALASGRLPLQKGAEALRDALRAKFGQVVSSKSISFDALVTRFKDRVSGLAGAVNLDPVNKSLEKGLKLFDANTVTGKSMVRLIDLLVKGVAWLADVGIKRTVEQFESASLVVYKIENQILRWRVQLKQGQGLVSGIAREFLSVKEAITGAANAFGLFGEKAGAQVPGGIRNGVGGAAKQLSESGGEMFSQIMQGFKTTAGIQSPSKEAAKMARYIPEGAALGVENNLQRPKEAAGVMSAALMPQPSPRVFGGGGNGGGVSNTYNITIPLQIIESPGGVTAWKSPEAKQEIARIIREAVSEGVH